MKNHDLNRFRELLPFYVNETLTDDNQVFMNNFLQQHPEFQIEVNFTHALRNSVKAVGKNRVEDAGLQRLLQTIRNDRACLQSAPTSWLQNLKESCRHWGLSPAFAVMTLVVAIQSVMLWGMYNADDSITTLNAYRSMPIVTNTADIKININPDTGFGNVVILLRQIGAHIVNGPSESGELWIALDDHRRFDEVIRQLQRTPGVVDAIVIDRNKH